MKLEAAKPQAASPQASAPKPPEPKPRPKPIRPKQFAWAFPSVPPPDGGAVPLRNAPAVDEKGRIFIHRNGRLFALEDQGEAPKTCWEYVTGSRAPGPVAVAPDGTLRLHCSDGLLHCLSFEGKQIYPPAGVGEPLGYAAPVADADGNTWVSAFGGGLTKVDADGRAQKPGRYFRSRQKFDAAGVIHQGVLYVGSEDGYMFAVELGEASGTNRFDHAAEHGYAGWYIHSSPVLTADGVLVVAGRDEHLYGFATEGQELFKTKMPGQMLASPVVDRHGQIYVGLTQSRRGQQPGGVLVCIDGNSHKIRWEYPAAAAVESTPVIGEDDAIYFGDNAGVIHAVDFHAQAKWTAEAGSPVRSAGTILAPERVAFGLDDETLMVLKCSSKGLAEAGWPKIGKTLGQCGLV